jgi:hypothetical protein
MMTPAQYCISWGKVGGGFGRSYSWELGRKVNRSTRENTFVWRGGVGVTGVAAEGATEGAFSFPLREANALNSPALVAASFPRDGPAVGIVGCWVPCGFKAAVAGWKLVRGR